MTDSLVECPPTNTTAASTPMNSAIDRSNSRWTGFCPETTRLAETLETVPLDRIAHRPDDGRVAGHAQVVVAAEVDVLAAVDCGAVVGDPLWTLKYGLGSPYARRASGVPVAAGIRGSWRRRSPARERCSPRAGRCARGAGRRGARGRRRPPRRRSPSWGAPARGTAPRRLLPARRRSPSAQRVEPQVDDVGVQVRVRGPLAAHRADVLEDDLRDAGVPRRLARR